MSKIKITFIIITTIAILGSVLVVLKPVIAATTYTYYCSIPGLQGPYATLTLCEGACITTTTGTGEELKGLCQQSLGVSPEYINLMIQKYTQWFMVIVGSIAVIVIIYAGLLYITAKGDPEKGTKARKMLIYAFVGLAITLLAGGAMWTILNFVKTS